MSFQFKHNAEQAIGGAIAETLRPAEPMTPSAWAAANLVVPDGPYAGQPFDLTLTPYLREPLDMLGPDSPVNEIAVMKSAQTGLSTMLIAIVGYLIDRAPCQALLIQPTSDAVMDFNREKLDRAIKASPALRRKVAIQTSRSSEGSTTYSKQFPGGSLTLAIASSAADLRSKTVRVLLRDEIDQYPSDLDGQGSPLEISDARLISFLVSGEWKKADVSTPTIRGASKIERRYEAGDQRRYHVPCPGCGSEFVFEFGPNFRFEQTFPHRAYYAAPCCGAIVENHQKRELLRRGRWIPAASRPGAFPSYHFDALSSPFVPWDAIAAERVAAGDDPTRLKTFENLWLGRPYEIRGDAPDHVRLMERREEGLTRGHIPPRGLLLVAAADVQMRGIWVEVVAVARNRESWVVEALYLDGSTESPDGEAFQQLKERILDHAWPDAWGRTRKVDALGVDSGYRSHVVYAWTRANQRIRSMTGGAETVLALKGAEGWGRPAIGLPSKVDIDLAGRRIRNGASVRLVGSWPLKGEFYSNLQKEGVRAGAAVDPSGYCHFPTWLDETYFRQITSEYRAEETFKGKPRIFWKLRASERDNHLLDCRVYNLALLQHLGFSKLTSDDWAALETHRGSSAGEELALWQAAAKAEAEGHAGGQDGPDGPASGVAAEGQADASATAGGQPAPQPGWSEGGKMAWGEAVDAFKRKAADRAATERVDG